MRQNTTGGPAHGARRFWLLLRWGVGVSILLALIVLFEVGIRYVPPDGMTVAYLYGPGPMHATYTAPHDQQTINTTYAALNATPVESQVSTSNALPEGCEPAAYPNITFTWHGIPLESWSGYCVIVESAGGISDTFMGTYHLWMPPTGPLNGLQPLPPSR